MVGGKNVTVTFRQCKKPKGSNTTKAHLDWIYEWRWKFDSLLFAVWAWISERTILSILFAQHRRTHVKWVKRVCVCVWVRYNSTNSKQSINSISYFGFSSGSGSFRPSPTGLFSASSAVTRWSSASTLPCKWKHVFTNISSLMFTTGISALFCLHRCLFGF